MGEIRDKVIVITAASRGIGEATASMLAEKSAKVVVGQEGKKNLDKVE